MKKTLLLAVLFLSACSQSGNESKNSPTITEESALESASGVTATPESGAFESTGPDVSITFTVKTINSTLRTEVISLTQGTQGFSLLTSSCVNFSKSRPCTLRAKFTAGTRITGLYEDTLNIGDLAIPLSVNLVKPGPDYAGIKVSEGSVEDATAIDFGTLSSSGSVAKSLIIKDTAKKAKETLMISVSNSSFTLSVSSCTSVALNSTAGCSVRAQFSSTGKAPGTHTANLLLADKTITLSAIVQSAPIVVGTPDLRILKDNINEITEHLFGTVNLNDRASTIIKVKNVGTGTAINSATSVTGSGAFTVSGSTCSSVLAAGAICQMTVNLNALNILGPQAAVLSYGGKSINLSANVVGSCPTGKHLEGFTCINNVETQTLANGSRVRIYTVATSSWSDWNYTCAFNYAPNPQAGTCQIIFVTPDAPVVTMDLSNDKNSLNFTSTCRSDLYGVFLDMYYAPDTLPSDPQYPIFINDTFLHEDVAFSSDILCIPTGMNNQGLMTLSVPVADGMRGKMVFAHGIIKGSLMWDNNRNSLPSEQVSVYVGCPDDTHLNDGVCESNIQTEPIANGSRTRQYNLADNDWGNWQYSCETNYSVDGEMCVLDTYTAGFSAIVNNKTEVCSGTETVSATLISCTRNFDGQEDPTLQHCANMTAPEETHASPYGTRVTPIDNGSANEECQEGQTSWTVSSLMCNEDYYSNGLTCLNATYVAEYSDYSPAIPDMVACDGTVTSTRTIIGCTQQNDSQSVALNKCSDNASIVVTKSPPGNYSSTTPNGIEHYSCEEGSSDPDLVLRECDEDYYSNGSDYGSGCVAVTYVPTYSAYTPAIPTNLVACDGTITSTRTITGCARQNDGVSVALNKCSDPTPSVYTQSPAGSSTVGIANGTETSACTEGSNTLEFVSRTCNTNFTDNGSACKSNITNMYSDFGATGMCLGNAMNQVYCWGYNPWLANGTGAGSPTLPKEVVSFGQTIKQMSNTYYNSCVIGGDNKAYCAGYGAAGGLGNNTNVQSNVYVPVDTTGVLAGKTIKKIVVAGGTSCAIASDDKLYCWGMGTTGQLGNGTNASVNTPAAVNVSGVLAGRTVRDFYIAQEVLHIVTTDNKLFVCGSNFAAKLGVGSTPPNSTVPVEISMTNLAGKSIKDVHVGSIATCLTTTDNLLYCWGGNTDGATGVGTLTGSTYVPTAVNMNGALAGKTIKSVVKPLSTYNGYLITTDNKLYSWGGGFYGTLGNGQSGANKSSAEPVAVVGVLATKQIVKVSAYGNAACALTTDNKVYCWGQGGGNGLHLSATISTPTEITLPNQQ